MKYQKFYRIFSIALILSLLMMVIPATPTLARGIEIDKERAEIGEYLEITGESFLPSNFDTNDIERVNIYFSPDEAIDGEDIDDEVKDYRKVKDALEIDEQGDFDARFRVPSVIYEDGDEDDEIDVKPGPYYVYVTYYGSKRIREYVEVTVLGSGEITIKPKEGSVGTEVEIDGEDFGYREDITIEYDDGVNVIDVKIIDGDKETDRDNEFNSTLIIIPESAAGEHTIRVTGDESGSEAEATFTVEPEITVSPDSGGIDTEVTVSGTGFGYRSDFDIFINGTKVATDTTDRYGTFDVSFNMPGIKTGLYDIEAEDADANSAKADFSFTLASATLTPTAGHIGTEVTATGAGFTAGSTVTIKYDATEIATPAVETDGTFSATFKVPAGKYGDHEIIISDDVTTKLFTFTMESKAPPVPTPLSPAMELQVEPPVKIDWEDVTDDSPPVTYELQIATNSDFTALSIQIEKKGLPKSEYTLSAVEKLEPTSEEAPYYWRIRAVDGAANESRWTGAGSFFVVATDDKVDGDGIGGFKLPLWAKYVLGGFGALLIGFLGFWLGRRTAYYSY